MNTEIVKSINKESYVSTNDLWRDLGYTEHRALKRLISNNKIEFLEHGLLRFHNAELDDKRLSGVNKKRGRLDKSYLLNEYQFITLITLVRSSPVTNVFKRRVVSEFKRMREALKELHKPSAQLKEIRKLLLLDAPSEWVKLFPPEFYTALMKLYGQDFVSNKHTPPYCGQITRKQIYDRVLPNELQNEIDDKISTERKHQWFTEQNGRATLLNQINQVTGIARMSRDRVQFEMNCAIAFDGAPLQLSVFL